MLFDPRAESMPRAQLAALQLERLRWTVEWATARVPFHARQCAAAGIGAGDVRSLDDVVRLPFMRKSDLRAHYPDGLWAVPRADVARIQGTSGTRGKPTLTPYTRADLDLWAEVVARSLAAAGVRAGDLVHIAYGYGLFTGGLGLHGGAERLGASVLPASGGNTPRQLLLMQDLRPRVLCCTPSYALHLADAMGHQGIDPRSIGIEIGIFGAESWTETMRSHIESAYGCRALDIYGLAEVIGPGVAMQSAEDGEGLFVWEDHFYPEVVDPVQGTPLPEGTEGELVFTSLTKQAFPLIRYRTGDLCSLTRAPSPSGRTMVRMSRIKGRADDMLVVRGVNVFPSEIERVVVGVAGLSPHYELVLAREGTLDVLTVRVEAQPAAGGADAAPATLGDRAARALTEALGIGARVLVEPPGTLPRSEGKAVRLVDRRG